MTGNTVLRPRPRPHARRTLVCFGFCGGGASVFRPWAGVLPDDVELAMVCYPGREGRFGEPFARDWDVLVDEGVAAVTGLGAHRAVLFGHSMGARVAFDVALRLQLGGTPPAALAVSASAAPGRLPPGTPQPDESDEDLLSWMSRVGQLPPVVRAEPDLRRIAVDLMRADLAVARSRRPVPGRVSVPVQVLYGAEDPEVAPADAAAWAEHAEHPVELDRFDGGHFYTPLLWAELPRHLSALRPVRATEPPPVASSPADQADQAGLVQLAPLSAVQEGVLFHAEHSGTAPDVYATQFAADLAGALDPAVLRAACEALLRRHAALRAGFRTRACGALVQVVPGQVTTPFTEVDLRGRESELAELMAGELATGFDPQRPPLLRFTLVRLDADRHRLVCTSHHALLDCWSRPIVLRELALLYAAGGDGSALPPVPSLHCHADWLAGQDREAARAAWVDALAVLDGPTLLVPPDPGRPSGPAVRGCAELPAGLAPALHARAAALGVPVHTVVQAAWAVLLGGLTGRDDAVFGTVVSGRPAELPGGARMVGLFGDTLPVPVRWSRTESFAELLVRLRDEQAALLPHRHLSLVEIHDSTGFGTLFDTSLAFRDEPAGGDAQQARGVLVTAVPAAGPAHHPLGVVVLRTGDRMSLRFEHRPDLLDDDLVRTLRDRLVRLLDLIAHRPDQLVCTTDLLLADERRLLDPVDDPTPLVAAVASDLLPDE